MKVSGRAPPSIAVMTNVTGTMPSVPLPIIVTLCATSSKVTAVTDVDWKFVPVLESVSVTELASAAAPHFPPWNLNCAVPPFFPGSVP